MTEFIYPLITTIWREKNIPKEWNKGAITSLYKGKGDKELAQFLKQLWINELKQRCHSQKLKVVDKEKHPPSITYFYYVP